MTLSSESRVLSVLPVFAHGLVHGHYHLHQYFHSNGHRLIGKKQLPMWVFVYASTQKPPSEYAAIARHVEDQNVSGTLPISRAVMGAVLLDELPVSAVRARYPLVPLVPSSQTLHVCDRIVFEPITELDFPIKRHDAWVTFSSETMVRLASGKPPSTTPMERVCHISLPDNQYKQLPVAHDGRILFSRKKFGVLLECKAKSVCLLWYGSELKFKDAYFYVPDDGAIVEFNLEATTIDSSSETGSMTSSSLDSCQSEPLVFEDEDMQERYMFLLTNRKTPLNDKYWRRDTKKFYAIVDGNLEMRRQQRRMYNSVARKILAHINPTLIVVPTRAQMKDIILKYHVRAHDGRERLELRLGNWYRFKCRRGVIQEVLGVCERCQEFSQRYPKLVQAIITTRPMELVMFDLTKLPVVSVEGYHLLLTIVDHFTKYKWAFGLKSKHMEAVADILYNLFKDRAVPERWHCDNGKEFVNQCMMKCYENWVGWY